MVAGILIEISNRNVDKIFEYNIPSDLINNIKVGIRVLVPFGKMKIEGFVLEIKDDKSTDKELRSIISIIDKDIILNDELLEIGKIMSRDLLATLISCYQVMLPKGLKAKNGTSVNIKYDTYYKLSNDYDNNYKFNNKQLSIINLLKENGYVRRDKLLNISLSSVNTLVKKGVIVKELKEHYRLNYKKSNYSVHELTDDQKHVVSEVIKNSPNTFLLYGVN